MIYKEYQPEGQTKSSNLIMIQIGDLMIFHLTYFNQENSHQLKMDYREGLVLQLMLIRAQLGFVQEETIVF